MLKRLLLALLLANGLFLAYTQGWLAFAGLVPQEPASRTAWPESPTAHREAETAKAHRG